MSQKRSGLLLACQLMVLCWLRRRRFFLAGKPVGPFDPNKILNERLLQALREVREGNLKPLKRVNAYD